MNAGISVLETARQNERDYSGWTEAILAAEWMR